MLKENRKMTDPWFHILQSIEPEIEKLQKAMDQGPRIKSKLNQNNRGAWQITFYPEWFGNAVKNYPEYNSLFDDMIEWAVEELEKWNAWRSSYDTWVFSNKDEAEKFITFYTLKWASE